VAITNGYTTLNNQKTFLSITDSSDDTLLENLIESASRSIDRIANRRFYADAAASARTYRAYSNIYTFVDDISSTSGLIVQTDDDGDGTFETTLTITTDFLVEPCTAITKGRPITQLTVVNTSKSFPIFPGLFSNGLRPGFK